MDKKVGDSPPPLLNYTRLKQVKTLLCERAAMISHEYKNKPSVIRILFVYHIFRRSREKTFLVPSHSLRLLLTPAIDLSPLSHLRCIELLYVITSAILAVRCLGRFQTSPHRLRDIFWSCTRKNSGRLGYHLANKLNAKLRQAVEIPDGSRWIVVGSCITFSSPSRYAHNQLLPILSSLS